VPVTYINSSASIKAFVGDHGGIVCTSTNAAAAMRWAWDRGEKLLMLPDQHLGRNTAYKLGVPLDRMVVWDPHEYWGGLTLEQVKHARLILWKGHCSVHTRFTVQQIDAFRKKYPAGKIVAHPECTFDVVQAADASGSTEGIVKTIAESPSGSIWAVATEIHLVNRLAHQFPDKTIVTLDPFGCLCSTMFRVSPNHLLWTLEGLVEGRIYNHITVPDDQKRAARLALDRMLALG
jgi:quinolinate synthase